MGTEAIEADLWAAIPSSLALANTTLEDGRFSVRLDRGRFECFLSRRPGADRLFVLLAGARNPDTQPLPRFDRWSWAHRFPGHLLAISDPTLYLDNRLGIGWYVGTEERNWLLRMSGLVRIVAEKLGVPTNNVICYGSSAGGFASMMLAAQLEDATAVAINPQTEVLKYSKRFVDHFLRIAFPGKRAEDLSSANRARLSAIAAFRRRPKAKCLLVQNLQDSEHHKRHFQPFCAAMNVPAEGGTDPTGRLRSLLYSDPLGHGREPESLVDDLVKQAVLLSKIRIADTHETQGRMLPKMEDDPSTSSQAAQPTTTAATRMRASQIYLLRNKLQRLEKREIEFHPPGRQDLKPYRINVPIDWAADPFKDRNWCAQLHMWRMMDNHLLEFDKTSDTAWLELPVMLIIDWHSYHIAQARQSKFAWMDMMVGLRSMKLAFVLSAHRANNEILSAHQQALFSELVDAHLKFLLDPSKLSYSNHTLIDMHGLAALDSVIEGHRHEAIDTHLKEVMPKLLALQFNRYGVHLENSPGYQKFGIGCLARLEASGWFDTLGVQSLLAKARAVDKWFNLPDGRCVPVGDTDGAPMPSVATVVIDSTNELINNSGYVIYRDDGRKKLEESSYFFVMAAFNSQFHKQSDDLSFVWFEGEDILCDAGKFGYKASEMRGYVQSTRAHNTVEVDHESSGQNFSLNPELAYGSAVKQVATHPWGISVSAEVSHPKSGVRHRRHFLYRPKQWVLVIDQLAGQRGMPHHYTQWFHFSPHLAIVTRESLGIASVTLRSGKVLKVECCGSGRLSTTVVRGQLKPVRQGWISQKYGSLTENDALGFAQEGVDAIFATLLSIGDRGSELTVCDVENVSLVATNADDTHRLRISLNDAACNIIEVA